MTLFKVGSSVRTVEVDVGLSVKIEHVDEMSCLLASLYLMNPSVSCASSRVFNAQLSAYPSGMHMANSAMGRIEDRFGEQFLPSCLFRGAGRHPVKDWASCAALDGCILRYMKPLLGTEVQHRRLDKYIAH